MGLGKGKSRIKHGNRLVSMLDFWGVHDFFSRGSLNQKKLWFFYQDATSRLQSSLMLISVWPLRAAAFAVVLSAFANEPMAHKMLQKWTARAVGRRLAVAPWCDATTPCNHLLGRCLQDFQWQDPSQNVVRNLRRHPAQPREVAGQGEVEGRGH